MERLPRIKAWHRKVRTEVLPLTPLHVARNLYADNDSDSREHAFQILLQHTDKLDAFVDAASAASDSGDTEAVASALDDAKLATDAALRSPTVKGTTLRHSGRFRSAFRQAYKGDTDEWADWREAESITSAELAWGRFPPTRVYNVDQVPLPFVVGMVRPLPAAAA